MNYDRTPFETDKPGEECGVFGAYDFDGHDISSSIYYGLFALQHRGQESCGIAVSDTEGPKGKVDYYKDMGLVNEVFDEERLNRLHGNIGVGHVRYSTAGASNRENAQPLIIHYIKGTLAVAHNGNLTNAVDLREKLKYSGAIFRRPSIPRRSPTISHASAYRRKTCRRPSAARWTKLRVPMPSRSCPPAS